jgi:hypothetical protein
MPKESKISDLTISVISPHHNQPGFIYELKILNEKNEIAVILKTLPHLLTGIGLFNLRDILKPDYSYTIKADYTIIKQA